MDRISDDMVLVPGKESLPQVDGSAKSQELHGWRLFVVIVSLFLGAFLIALDVNIINVPVPEISTEFGALEDIAWYGSAYLLTITAFQPTFGTFYKYFNIDTTYRICIILFEIGSLICAAAKSSHAFIVGRAIAGLGAAGVLQGALAVIGQAVELRKRSFYMGVVISVFIITVCIGPVLGGTFTEHVSWRWCFWINLPIGGVVLLLLFFCLNVPGSRNSNRTMDLKSKLRHLDPIGCILFTASITCLLLALQWAGQSKAWSDPTIIGLFVGCSVLFLLFCLVQWKRGDKATIPLRVLSTRSIWTGAAVLFFLGATTAIVSFYIPFYFQVVQDVGPITAGVRFIPLMLPQMVALVLAGIVVTLWGHFVPYMLAGELICIIGLSLLTRLTTTTSTLDWASALVVTGFGLGMAMQLPYTAVQISLTEEDLPIGNAIAVFAWQLGGAIGIPMGQNIAINTLMDQIPTAVPGLSGRDIISVGASGLSSIIHDVRVLSILRSIWANAIVRIIFLCIALTAASVPFTLAMEWKNSKRVALEREQAASNDLKVPVA